MHPAMREFFSARPFRSKSAMEITFVRHAEWPGGDGIRLHVRFTSGIFGMSGTLPSP